MTKTSRNLLLASFLTPHALVVLTGFRTMEKVDGCFVQDDRFVEAEGGCKDLRTGLVWSKLGSDWDGVWSWSKWKAFMRRNYHNGYQDWRMPTVAELHGLRESETVVTYDDGRFPTLMHVPHWAIRTWSSEPAGGKRYWTVNLSTGLVEATSDGSWSPALAVRQGTP